MVGNICTYIDIAVYTRRYISKAIIVLIHYEYLKEKKNTYFQYILNLKTKRKIVNFNFIYSHRDM